MPWDTNKFVTLECRLCSPIDTLDEIVTGANERCTGVKISLLATPNELYSLYNMQNAIQTKITALIPLYVNHTLPVATPGNYDGQTAYRAPEWTEATILTAIGAVSRLVPNRLFVDREWAMQQYKIINLLRWGQLGFWSSSRISRSIKSVSGKGWATTVAAFHSAPYSIVGDWRFNYYATQSSTNNYQISVQAINLHYQVSIPFSVDLYGYAGTAWSGSGKFQPFSSITKYGTGFYNGVMNSYKTFPETIDLTCQLVSEFDIDSEALFAPSLGSSNRYYSTMDEILIIKFTGLNGFQYQDWR